MLGFANPLMLAGLAAVGLPVLIHFLTRPRPRVIRYPTYHLLREAGAGRQALDRLRTWLVLVLRTLAVAALALLFARPVWRAVGTDADERAARRVVLVVDASMSMNATDGGVTLFTRARAQAADLLRSLEPGSQAGIVYMGARTRAVLPALSRNLSVLHEGLSEAKPTLEFGDASAALAEAARMLEGSGAIYVFSDFQRTNWGAVDFGRHEGLAFFLKPVTDRPVDNCGIVSVDKSPGRPLAGEHVTLSCRVFNASAGRRVETVRLDMEGVSHKADVELAPYSSGMARLRFSVPRRGHMPGRVMLRQDALSEDDVRYFDLEVRDELRALLVCDADPNDPASPALFVRTALCPDDQAAQGIEVLHRRSAEVEQRALQTADLFVLVCPVRLSGGSVQTIARRVQEGAHLMCWLDGPSASPLLGALAGSSDGLVAPPFHVTDLVRAETPEPFAEIRTHRDPLQVFHDASGGQLSALRVRRHLRAEPAADRAEEVLIRYADGAPALALGEAGRGRAVYANLPVAPSGSNVAGSPLFPALVHELLRALRRTARAQDHAPGATWQLDIVAGARVAEGAELAMHGPDGAPVQATVVGRGRTVRLSLPPVPAPGHYPVRAGEELCGMGVVNVHPDETDTRPLDIELLLEEDMDASVTIVGDGEDLLRAGRNRPLWPHLLAAAAAFVAAEMLLLALWRRRSSRARMRTYREART